MPVDFKFECEKFLCGYYFTTSGDWEFYRDKEGNKKQYGHPSALNEEAERRGVWGYSAFMHCLDCDNKSEIIVSEIPNCFREKGFVWEWPWRNRVWFRIFYYLLSRSYKIERKLNVKCPHCESLNLISHSESWEAYKLKEKIQKVSCPKCKEGFLKWQREATY